MRAVDVRHVEARFLVLRARLPVSVVAKAVSLNKLVAAKALLAAESRTFVPAD